MAAGSGMLGFVAYMHDRAAGEELHTAEVVCGRRQACAAMLGQEESDDGQFSKLWQGTNGARTKSACMLECESSPVDGDWIGKHRRQ